VQPGLGPALASPQWSSWPPFPPEDLLKSLVNLYFCHINIAWPLLQRPAFEADIADGRHLRDLGFACVLLGVCAGGSRSCEDSRVIAKVRRGRGYQHTASPPSLLPWEGAEPWIDDLEQHLEDEDTFFAKAPGASAGWKYYNRVQRYHAPTMAPATLTDLQTIFVSDRLFVILGLTNAEITCTEITTVNAAVSNGRS
jgi:hypothetical protein